MAKIIKAPAKFAPLEGVSLFEAGSIEQGRAENWQQTLEDSLRDLNVTILNPRREDWDSCVDKDTYALMKKGIKHYSELREGMLILTYNITKDCLEYKPIVKLNIKEVNTLLYIFKRNGKEFLFSSNHNVLVRRNRRRNPYDVKLVKVKDLVKTEKTMRIPTDKPLNYECDELGIEQYPDDYFLLTAWILSEGSITDRKDNNGKVVFIWQFEKNKKNRDRIKSILNSLNLEFGETERGFRLGGAAKELLFNILKVEKYKLPIWIRLAPTRQRLLFIKEYLLGDGTSGNIIFFSKKYTAFAKEMQHLCYESGLTSSFKEQSSGFGSTTLHLNLMADNKKWLCLSCAGQKRYKDIMWCPATENNTWIAVRNDIPFITGNSWIQSIKNPQFRKQVEWELLAQELTDIIGTYFSPGTKSPITLLELGLFARTGKLIVCCPKGFWRKGNVEIVCKWHGIKLVDTFQEFISQITCRIRQLQGKIAK